MDMTGLMVLLSEHLLRHVTLLSIRPPPAAGSTWQAANVQHLPAKHHEREDVPVTYHMILQNQQLSSHLRDEGSYCVIALGYMYLSAAGSTESMGQWPMRKLWRRVAAVFWKDYTFMADETQTKRKGNGVMQS